MFEFLKPARLVDIVGTELIVGVGIHALRARGPVRVVEAGGRFDLRVGPATLETLDGAVWSAYPFALTAGLGGDAQFEGRTFAVEPREFTVLEFPGEVWFGLEVRLTEQRTTSGPCLVSSQTVSLGVTTARRFARPLEKAQWIAGSPWRASTAPEVWPPEVVHRSLLPEQHTAVHVAPELYGVLRDCEEGDLRFSFPREKYDEALRIWRSVAIAVEDTEMRQSTSPSLRDLTGPQLSASSLLLLPWLGLELTRRARGNPIVQLFNDQLCCIDDEDPDWREALAAEGTRLSSSPDGLVQSTPLTFRDGAWVAAE